MSQQNNHKADLAGLLRVLFRWKYTALFIFTALSVLTVSLAWFIPLKYESQVILERKPTKVSPQRNMQVEEFEVGRLTSETQRNVALLKSRAMIESWSDAVGIRSVDVEDKERNLKKLYKSLNVQPVNYTDLIILKVKSTSPEEANRRAKVLTDLYTEWDAQKNGAQAQELIQLLRVRLRQVKENLAGKLATLKQYKSSVSLNLSGFTGEKDLEMEIQAHGKLYDMLSVEMEEAERQRGDSLRRIRVIAPPTASGKPVRSRLSLVLVAVCGSLMSTFVLILLLEWTDQRLHQPGDISRVFPSHRVLSIPPFKDSAALEDDMGAYLEPLRDTIIDAGKAKGSVVVQVTSSAKGDGKTTFCSVLARLLRSEAKVCILRRTSLFPVVGIDVVIMERGFSVQKYLTDLKGSYAVFLLDNDSLGGKNPGSDLGGLADITCVLVLAGRTTYSFLHQVGRQIERFSEKKVFFIFNQFSDPLPLWMQK